MTGEAKLSSLLSRSLSGQLERVRHQAHELVAPLSEDQLWRRPFSYGNSIGHLLLHLTGNLSYYIGTQIVGTGYVRDRPKEFADSSRPPKEAVLRALDGAVRLVQEALAAQGDTDWSAAYGAIGADEIGDRLTIFVRCVSHADHHLGQMIYLRQQLEREK